jgi:uroporphyrinogen decarboxylase
MNSLERVRAALQHKETDRVPRLLYGEVIGYVPAIEKLLLEKCAPQKPRDYFEMDLTGVATNPTKLSRDRFAPWHSPDALASGEVDEWGVWWKKGGFHHFAHIESPLKEINDFKQLQKYPWPDIEKSYRFVGVSDRIQKLHARGIAVTAGVGSVFEQAWYLRGMNNLLMDMMTAPAVAHYLFEHTAQLQKAVAQEFTRAGVDIIITGDDVAMQTGLMMSIDTWRKFLKNRLGATVQAVKAINPETKVFYHSDGNIEPLIPDLIEVGIDILNPIQPECMDPAEIKRRFGDRLSFWGTVSVQETMPKGNADDVRWEVQKRIRDVGLGGGFILAPAHVLSPEVPWENIVAFFEAADQIY